MQEFSRLAVGIALLGLAIFVSLNFQDDSAAKADGEILTEQSTVESEAAPEAGLPTNWQASAQPVPTLANGGGSSFEDSSIARPDFSQMPSEKPLPNSSSENLDRSIHEPPMIANQYSPVRPLMVSGRLQRENNLVPVQPKPSFRGTLTRAFQVHVTRHGDTLQSLSSEYYGSPTRYLEIYRVNKDVLSSPLSLPVGVEIRIPSE